MLNLQPMHITSKIHRRKYNCPQQAYETSMALQTVVPLGRLGFCLARSLAFGWAAGEEEMSP